METEIFKKTFFPLLLAILIQLLSTVPAMAAEPYLIDIVPGEVGSVPLGLISFNNGLIFAAYEPASGREIWRSNGTLTGTTMMKDIIAGPDSCYDLCSQAVDIEGTVFFDAKVGSYGPYELWKTDGTEAGTEMVRSLSYSILDNFLSVGSTLFFTRSGDLWKSDGSYAGTEKVADISTAYPTSKIAGLGSIVFFGNNDDGYGEELWKTDGTEAGTVLVKDINPGGSSYPFGLTDVSGTLFFCADDGVHGFELWKSDGFAATTSLVKDIREGSSGSCGENILTNSGGIANVGGTLYFIANDGIHGYELWKSDGTEEGTVLVKDINATTLNSPDYNLTNVNGILFFTPNHNTYGIELWKSDGTEEGTVLVKDIYPGGSHSSPGDLTDVNGVLYFTAYSSHGKELWTSDGTEAGTFLVKDIREGSASSGPYGLTNANGTLFFAADDGIHGKELWLLPPSFHDLTINSTVGGTVTAPGEGVFQYDDGTMVDLVATPDPEYRFVNWSGDTENVADVNAFQTTVTISGDYVITANFEAAPDLVITDMWGEDGHICYQVRNIGGVVAPSGHTTNLSIDKDLIDVDLVEANLLPGERLTRCFSGYSWDCSSLTDAVHINADLYQKIAESDETNNFRDEEWRCDTIPPFITTLPLLSQITPESADIAWSTDTPSNSVVMYGPAGGVFEFQQEDQQQTDTHLVHLDNLEPSTTYHYLVLSTDESGNTVKSDEGYFQTDPVPDDSPPTIIGLQVVRGLGDIVYYTMTAAADDNTGVARVEFLMDGSLVCTDYNEPFECQLAPVEMGMSAAEFFQEHAVEAVAYDYAGLETGFGTQFNPVYECEDIRAHIDYPFSNQVYYVENIWVPSGTTIPIRVYASMPGLTNCSFIGIPGLPPGASRFYCDEQENTVSEVRFYLDNELIATETPSTQVDFGFTVDADISGFSLGTYEIRVEVIGNEACMQTLTRNLIIEQGTPELDISREVTREGNYFKVDLILENLGTWSVDFDLIRDNLSGFQPIAKIEADHDIIVSASDHNRFQSFGVTIDFAGSHFTLEAYRTKRISYLAVPIMYPPGTGDTAQYRIGQPVPIRVVDDNDNILYEFERPCQTTESGADLSSEVNQALRYSDYLVVTNPVKLDDSTNDSNALNGFLSSVAELARYRNGILGYLMGSGSDDANQIKKWIRTWGTPMRGVDGVSERYLSNGGYLLFVGETEIVPSFTKKLKTAWYDFDKQNVRCTDMPYGDMTGETDPELSVGRIIGDNLAEMKAPIEASINVVKGDPDFEFDRSHALIVSGDGDGVDSFEGNLDDVEDILDDQFFVTSLKKAEVEGAGDNINEQFKLNDGGMDALFYRDHCNPFRWSGVVGWRDFQGLDSPDDGIDRIDLSLIDFESAKPFAFACCCQAGQYEDDADQTADSNNIAESFLQNGVPVYIGSTENSDRSQNNSAAKWFYNHWVNTTKPVGRTFRELKVHLDKYKGDFWSYEYNLYGDPKYGGGETTAAATLSMPADIPVPPSPYEIIIPDYVVKTEGNEDHVTIPDGNMLLEEGKPAVPFYKVNVEFPVGYTVQDVNLSDRSGLVTATGLDIPLTTAEWDGGGPSPDPASTEEWWPPFESDFEYHFETRLDGTSVLTITVYPFYYNALTTDVKFYKNYTFDIQSVVADVGIAFFKTDKDSYVPGEIVNVTFTFSGSEISQDAIAEVVVKDESSDEVVDGLALQALSGLTETSSLALEWDSTGFAPGSYYIQANIRTSDGGLLYTLRQPFSLGVNAIQIDDFTVTPTSPDVNMSFTFQNTGSLETSGTAIVKIQDEQDNAVEEFRHSFSALQPSEVLNFVDTWGTSGETPGVYRAQAYVLYDSKSTDIRSHAIPICLDLSAVAQAFGWTASDSSSNTYIDFDRDGDVDGLDLIRYKTYLGFGDCF